MICLILLDTKEYCFFYTLSFAVAEMTKITFDFVALFHGCQDISVEEFGEELATKLKTIIDECLKPEKSRPEMHLLLSVLKGKITSHKNKVELYCVGTGTGTTGTKITAETF